MAVLAAAASTAVASAVGEGFCAGRAAGWLIAVKPAEPSTAKVAPVAAAAGVVGRGLAAAAAAAAI